MKRFLGLLLIFLLSALTHSQENSTQNLPPYSMDFSSGKIYAYDYSHSGDFSFSFDRDDEANEVRTISRGVFEIQSRDDGTADLLLKDQESISVNPESEADEEEWTEEADSFLQGLLPDGKFLSPTGSYFNFFFLLPTRDLKEGETEVIPMYQSVNVQNSILLLKGYAEIEYVGDETANGTANAIFKADFDLSEFNIPVGIEGEFDVSIKGSGIWFFDKEKGNFTRIKVTIFMDMLVNMEPEQTGYLKSSGKSEIELKLKDIKK